MTEAVVDKAHSKRGPSGAKKRKLCPGSVVMEEGRPDRPSRYAAEGTVAHTVMELCLTEGKDAEAFVGRIFTADGFAFEVDMEMADPVNEFIAEIGAHIDTLAGDILLVEQSVSIEYITGEKDGAGTADVVGITQGGTHLVVADYKHGKGVKVFVADQDGNPNGQIATYGLGVLEEVELVHDIQTVTLIIGQPRMQHFDTMELTVQELRDQLPRLRAIERKCDSAEADAKAAWFAETYLVPGEEQCRFCKGKTVCPALASEVDGFASEAAQVSDFADLTTPVVIDPSSGLTVKPLAELMARVPLVEQWCLAIRAELEGELFAGAKVPGWKLVQGKRGNRAWADKVAASAAMKAARLKRDEMFKDALRSPTEMEKLLKKARPKVWSKLAALITQSDGRPSVAPESDDRPVYDPASKPSEFADLTVADGNDLV